MRCIRGVPFFQRVVPFAGLLLLLFLLGTNALALNSHSCPGGAPVTSFRMLVEPPSSGPPLPVAEINMLGPGQKLKYEPVHLSADLKKSAEVAVVLIPSIDDTSGLRVLRPKRAGSVAQWDVPIHAMVVGLVFGEHGLNAKKVSSLVRDNPEVIAQLADYADQSSKVEALVQTLAKYDQSSPGSSDLQAMLHGFSAQYGVSVPKLDPSTPADQQANALLRAVVPSFQGNNFDSKLGVAEHSTGLAASVASMFFGTPVGLAAGGAALVENLHTAMFPGTDFEPAFTQLASSSDGLTLCSANRNRKKTRKNVAYLWMQRIPDASAPQITLGDNLHVPIGWTAAVPASTASVAQLKLVSHARDWRLVAGDRETPILVKVATENSQDVLTLDLTHVKLSPGQYRLAAKWDWAPLTIAGQLDALPLGDLSTAKVTDNSADSLIAGAGLVPVQLTGADFEFLNSASLRPVGVAASKAIPLDFVLPKGKSAGEQQTVQVDVSTASLRPGAYLLELKQVNGAAHDVPITVHPPNPKLDRLPLRVNVGEKQQTVLLHGSALDRIDHITSAGAEWKLAPVPKRTHDGTEREATVSLAQGAKPGQAIAADVFVTDLNAPLKVSDALEILGPRPKILNVNKSFASQFGVQLHDGELPSGLAASFAIQVENAGDRPTVQLACEEESYARQTLTLRAGEKQGSTELEPAGQGVLFLLLNPAMVGQSGCTLKATIISSNGSSDPYALGRIIRLPHIDKFTVQDEKVGPGLYAGTLMGEDLQMIAKTGWSPQAGYAVRAIATPVPQNPEQQTLKIAVPWPPPSPQAPLYIWLQGENQGRITNATY
jgi:hypothetical protein